MLKSSSKAEEGSVWLDFLRALANTTDIQIGRWESCDEKKVPFVLDECIWQINYITIPFLQ